MGSAIQIGQGVGVARLAVMTVLLGLLAGCARKSQTSADPPAAPAQTTVQVGYAVNLDFEAGLTRRAEGPKAGAPDFGSWTQCIDPDHFRGKRVRYSGWLRTSGATGEGAALWMRVDGPDNRALAFDNMDGRRARGTTAWTRYEVVLDVPHEATQLCFGWLLSGPGTGWADDLKFEFVDGAVPVTGKQGR
jgi:hypothetical protein